jgi:hypothetical protein
MAQKQLWAFSADQAAASLKVCIEVGKLKTFVDSERHGQLQDPLARQLSKKLTAGRGDAGACTPQEPGTVPTWRQLQQGRSLKDGAQGRSLHSDDSPNGPAVRNM